MTDNGSINHNINIGNGDVTRIIYNRTIDDFNNIYNKFNMNNTEIPRKTENNGSPFVIYRFKFTEEFMEELYQFSKIHQYDNRQDFKEAWKIWTEEKENIIYEEMRKLINLGYNGDILDKMFKSARYYFRNKCTKKKEPRQRRVYISVNQELLNNMDTHIESNIYDVNYQPKTGFIAFCKDNEILLKETITTIFGQGITDSSLIRDKIKKTYKNRYFMFTNKNKQVKNS